MIPDCVGNTLGNLMGAIDSGALHISYLAANGRLVDLTKEGRRELAGSFGGGDGWTGKYSQQRFVDDSGDAKEWVRRHFGGPRDEEEGYVESAVPEIEEFAKVLVREVRDRSVTDCDTLLRPDVNSPCNAVARGA